MAQLNFTVDSALLSELGEKLVQSVHVALVELIKNSYDADASEVIIKFERYNSVNFKGSSAFQEGDLAITNFENEYKNEYVLVNEVLQKHSINTKNISTITAEQLRNVFNELIHITNLIQLLVENKELSKAQTGETTHETIFENMQKLVEIYPLTLKKNHFKVEITDNGVGMNHEEVKKYWMRIATTNKVENIYSKIYGRRKTGAKGIGRFCCRRLGTELRLETTSKNNGKFESTSIFFDWSKFLPGKDVSTINVVGEMKTVSDSKVGTKLIINGSKMDEWSNRGYDFVKRQLSQLVSNRGQHVKGYKPDPGFNIVIDAEGTRMETKDLRNEVMEAGWGVLTGRVEKNGIAIYNLNALNIGKKEIKGDKKFTGLEGITFKIGIFPTRKEQWRNNKILSKKGMSETLEEWGGVQVNLNNFKVYVEDDWLDIDRDRALSKGSVKGGLIEIAERLKFINPSRALLSMLSTRSYLGTVEISTDLKGFEPKLNREGFLDSKETVLLKEFVRYGIDWSSIYRDFYLRQLERKEVSDAESRFVKISGQKNSSSKEIVESAINYIETEVSKVSKLLPIESKKEFNSVIEKVKGAKEAIVKMSDANEEELHHLRLIASTSTLLLIFNHEVKSFLGVLERSKNTLNSILDKVTGQEKEDVKEIITTLGDSKKRFSDLINMTALIGVDSKNAPEMQLVLKKHIEKAIDCFKLIIEKYSIKIDVNNVPDNETIGPLQEAELYAIILNILSNSIKAVLASSESNKIIKIECIKTMNEIKLIFLDNGIGLSQKYFNDVFIPFVADPEKTLYANLDDKINQEDRMIVGSGSGLGLSIVKEILQSKKGTIQFNVPRSGWKTELEVTFK
ncbi:MAG: sensor histidine kinase [Elusimicrobiota bacterium]